jgi:hypothetical protein
VTHLGRGMDRAKHRVSRGVRGAAMALLASALAAPSVEACPSCWLSRQVWAAVPVVSFWTNLLAIAAPVLAIAVIAAWVHRLDLGPSSSTGRRQEGA